MGTETTPNDSERTFKVVFRKIRKARIGEEAVLTVYCPSKQAAVPLLECRQCDNFSGLSIDPTDRDTFLRCTCSDRSALPQSDPPLPGDGFVARKVPVSKVMTAPVRCATPEMSIEALTGMFLETGISAVPVVDGDGKAVGIVSKTDVLRAYYEGNDDYVMEPPEANPTAEQVSLDLGPGFHVDSLDHGSVADVMTHLVFDVGADASLSRAAALMAYEGVHRVVVSAPDGRAIGIVSSLDILRWLARTDGYIVPDASHGTPE